MPILIELTEDQVANAQIVHSNNLSQIAHDRRV